MQRIIVLFFGLVAASLQDQSAQDAYLESLGDKESNVAVQPTLNLDLLSVLRVVAKQELREEVNKLQDKLIKQLQDSTNSQPDLKTEIQETVAGLNKTLMNQIQATIQRSEETMQQKFKAHVQESQEKITNLTQTIQHQIQDSKAKQSKMVGFHTPKGGVILDGRLYVFNTDSHLGVTWDNALSFCKELGMNMLSLETEAESKSITNYITTSGKLASHGIWTSGKLVGSTWKWGTGQPFSYTNWFSGHPPNHGSNLCVWHHGAQKQWITSPCGTQFYAGCEEV